MWRDQCQEMRIYPYLNMCLVDCTIVRIKWIKLEYKNNTKQRMTLRTTPRIPGRSMSAGGTVVPSECLDQKPNNETECWCSYLAKEEMRKQLRQVWVGRPLHWVDNWLPISKREEKEGQILASSIDKRGPRRSLRRLWEVSYCSHTGIVDIQRKNVGPGSNPGSWVTT